MTYPELKDKVVLITGANNPLGIGAATAKAFACQGASVFITYLRLPPESCNSTVVQAQNATESGTPLYAAMRMKSADEGLDTLRIQGGRAATWEADLLQPENIPALSCTPVAGKKSTLVGT